MVNLNYLSINNAYEIINIILSIILSILIYRKKDNLLYVFYFLFIYGSIHFAHTALPLLSGGTVEEIYKQRIIGTGSISKISAALMMAVSLLAIIFSKNAKLIPRKKIDYILLVLIGFLIIGYVLESNIYLLDYVELLRLKYVLLEIYLLVVMYLALSSGNDFKIDPRLILYSCLYLVIPSVVIGTVEVSQHLSWASTLVEGNTFVYRASSYLYNPNLYAFWLGLIYILAGYIEVKFSFKSREPLCLMIICSYGIYISGSRGVAVILVFFIITSIFIGKNKIGSYFSKVLPISFLVIYTIAAYILPIKYSEYKLLGQRFFNMPFDILNYLLYKINIYFEKFNINFDTKSLKSNLNLLAPAQTSATREGTFSSIDGRFCANCDFGWYSLYHDVGLTGFLPIVITSLVFLIYLLGKSYKSKGPDETYKLIVYIYILYLGFIMRFQVFPVPLFMAIFLGIILIPNRVNKE